MSRNYTLDFAGYAVALAALGYRALFNRAARAKRALRRVPRRTLPEAVAGETIKVAGRLDVVGERLVAPLSGRHCAYYELVIEEWVSGGRSGEWRTLVERTEARSFVVRDAGVGALVRAAGAQVALHRDEHRQSGLLHAPTPELLSLLARYDVAPTGTFGYSRRLRFDEGVLEAGEHVAVCGAPAPWPDARAAADPPVPGDFGVRWVFEPRAESPLYLSDDPAVLLRPKTARARQARRAPPSPR